MERLTAAGYNAQTIQDGVNKAMAAKAKQYHKIAEGETLSEIAEHFGTTVSALVKLNGLKNPDLIYAGQKIRVK